MIKYKNHMNISRTCLFFRESAIAYSATTVLPAEVWAATSTDWSFSMQSTARDWKGSSVNL